jgi:hypothetical protein
MQLFWCYFWYGFSPEIINLFSEIKPVVDLKSQKINGVLFFINNKKPLGSLVQLRITLEGNYFGFTMHYFNWDLRFK